MTEQNMRLKDWIKTKKVHDKEKSYTRALQEVEMRNTSQCPTPNEFTGKLPKSLQQSGH